ncbi:MAG TPA: hypothetical protein VNZ58_10070 [Thermomicrobiales bacterium]|nr:hypothetical protein [Thermomicrobiales bacterium]
MNAVDHPHDGNVDWQRSSQMRVLALGTTGAGKSWTSERLSTLLNAPHIELDSLYWGEGWKPVDKACFVSEVARRVDATESWVADGNYRSVREMLALHATDIVWLDYPLPLVLWRFLRRTATRMIRREELWNGNRESVGSLISDRFSLIRYSIRQHRRLRTEVPPLVAGLDSELRFFRIRDRHALETMFEEFAGSRVKVGPYQPPQPICNSL